MSSGTNSLTGEVRSKARRITLSLTVAWIACDHTGCSDVVCAEGSAYDAAADVATDAGWYLSDRADYCPNHGDEHSPDESNEGDGVEAEDDDPEVPGT